MFKATALIICGLLGGLHNSAKAAPANPDEKLLFVFELVRHGARGPFDDHKLDEFPVAEGQLTPEGMRQRYLLGAHNRKRYTEEYPLLSADGEYNPHEFYIQSTNVNRTITSGYSELMGLYPLGKGTPLTTAQASIISGVASPPFKVREANKINKNLKLDALPGRPVQVPIFTYNDNNLNDEVSVQGCPFVEKTE